MFLENKKIFFIGIGGIGMSAIAKILINFNINVSGSDLSENAMTRELKALGVPIINEHTENNVIGNDIVVYSSAINKSNPELIKAKKLGITVYKRAQMLSEIMKLKKSIAVAGSHGKTTTSSILATILNESELKPSFIIGGIVNNLKSHAQVGDGEYLVAEADESDGSFLLLKPFYSIITNVDNDHLDFYKNFENVKDYFVKFANMTQEDGMNIINIEDNGINEIFSKIEKPCTTIGLSNKADYYASDIDLTHGEIRFCLNHEGQKHFDYSVYGFGTHNLLNTLGAIAASHKLGLSFSKIKEALLKFKGAKRRLDKLRETDYTIVFDDYAHHNTEILHTLNALKASYVDHKIECVFQPHRYSRTKESWDSLEESFKSADKVYVLDVYTAGESRIEGISAHSIKDLLGDKAVCITKEMIEDIIKDEQARRVITTLGAGSISNWIREYVEKTSR